MDSTWIFVDIAPSTTALYYTLTPEKTDQLENDIVWIDSESEISLIGTPQRHRLTRTRGEAFAIFLYIGHKYADDVFFGEAKHLVALLA